MNNRFIALITASPTYYAYYGTNLTAYVSLSIALKRNNPAAAA